MSFNSGAKLRQVALSISSSGDNTVIAAPTDGYIAIDHINLLTANAVTAKFKTGNTDISGAYTLDAKQAIVLENVLQHEEGVITCGHNEAFIINLGSGVQLSGFIRYRIVGGGN